MPQFSPTPWGLEIRPIIGVRNKEWEFIVNPIVDLSFGPGSEADFSGRAPCTQSRRGSIYRARILFRLGQDRQFPAAAAAEPAIVCGHRFQSERRGRRTRRRLRLYAGIGRRYVSSRLAADAANVVTALSACIGLLPAAYLHRYWQPSAASSRDRGRRWNARRSAPLARGRSCCANTFLRGNEERARSPRRSCS